MVQHFPGVVKPYASGFFPWLANFPLLFVLVTSGDPHASKKIRRIALQTGVLLAVPALFMSSFIVNAGGSGPASLRHGPAVFLWFSSFLLAAIAELSGQLNKGGIRSDKRIFVYLMPLLAAYFVVTDLSSMREEGRKLIMNASPLVYACSSASGLQIKQAIEGASTLWQIELDEKTFARSEYLVGNISGDQLEIESNVKNIPETLARFQEKLQSCRNSEGQTLSQRFGAEKRAPAPAPAPATPAPALRGLLVPAENSLPSRFTRSITDSLVQQDSFSITFIDEKSRVDQIRINGNREYAKSGCSFYLSHRDSLEGAIRFEHEGYPGVIVPGRIPDPRFPVAENIVLFYQDEAHCTGIEARFRPGTIKPDMILGILKSLVRSP